MSGFVTVAIPTYNAEPWIEATLASVLEQDVELDVIVSDDGSTDRTIDIAQSTRDRRVVVEPAWPHQGMARNWNRAIQFAAGVYVKLLMQDDRLLPGSLRRQVALLDELPDAGLAFAPRLLSVDGSPDADSWAARYGVPHLAIARERGRVGGQEVIRRLTRGRLRGNAIGEPSVVLIRRSVLARAGLFDPTIRQLTDFDLWLRIAAVADLAFDPEPVAEFRVHSDSATARNRRSGSAWLDRWRVVSNLHRSPSTSDFITPWHYAMAAAAGTKELAGALLSRVTSPA